MPFTGKMGICIKCKQKTIVVCKKMCQSCYMKKLNNREDVKQKKREWEKRNKHKRLEYRKKYHLQLKLRNAQRGIKIRTGEYVSINFLKEIFKRDKNTCQYCGSKRNLSIDHIKPISKGIDNSKENLLIACITCNAYKSDMSVKEFKKKYLK